MSPTPTRTPRRVQPSLIVSILALVIALSGTAYAVGKGEIKTANLADGAVKTAKLGKRAVTTPKIAGNAVNGPKVRAGSLRLSDLGGFETNSTHVVGTAITVPANECRTEFMTLFNPLPEGVVGSLVVGFLTDPNGGAVLPNSGYVVPTVVSETSQGGAIPNLRVCAAGSAVSVPAGSVFHWTLIGP